MITLSEQEKEKLRAMVSRRGRRLTQEARESIVHAYLQGGVTMTALAQEHGVTVATVSTLIRKAADL